MLLQEIQRANPRARRQALLIVVCGVVFGLILILLAQSYRPALEEWVSQDPHSRLRFALVAVFVAFVVPLLGLIGYFWRVGDRIVRAERFPAPGATVVRDTVVLRGQSARWRGRLIQFCAAILLLAAACFCILLWRLVSLLDPGAA